MAVNVRVGTGSFDDFDVIIDAEWNSVPREGETIMTGPADVYEVNRVRYCVGPDEELIGVQVLVVKETKVTSNSLKFV